MHLFLFGPGYTASRLAEAVRAMGWRVSTATRDTFHGREADLAAATHILSSVPPGESEPVLDAYRTALAAGDAWLGYLSSTGVYGDTQGAWVDESAPTGTGRRAARADADAAWLALAARVFRLPGIYGPGRSALDRIPAHRVDAPGQVFSRIHVDDIVRGVIAGFDGPPGAYNLADDLPAPQAEVQAWAAHLQHREPAPLVPLDDAGLSPQARAFYSENRRVSNGKAKRVLGWTPLYPDYRFGLRALSAITSPAITSTAPDAASSDQR
ncbi:NAD(P)-dependent oxidoreductase [Sphingomonas sp. AOB5]|uniref:NAD(P)-dependent oxidoreductase n=1 Tax=Sphingomonas sp. AOB5 TaxID=3034017 RepID=UPI0023F8CE4B|nr:NAD(P)-dependent oxidoreductase [Sphingomonas sp. AOB5]MDF7776704.1 NAD(P)-dependent oxidoreductase [Sphingomonas sp. AOB5]